MYVPDHYREDDPEILLRLMDENAFALLVAVIDGVPEAVHVPLLAERKEGGGVRLLGHVAARNPMGEHLDGQRVLCIFQGPHAYVSPRWYSGDKVPTWNYMAVHAYGTAELLDGGGVRDLLERLSARHEGDTPRPWSPDSLPEDLYARLQRAVVGFSIDVDDLQGKAKMDQNKLAADRAGAIAGLDATGRDDDRAVARLMRERLG